MNPGSFPTPIRRPRRAPRRAQRPPATQSWTVVGYWQEDQPIPVGVIAGIHRVHAGHDALPWTTIANAATPAEAERLAVADMRESVTVVTEVAPTEILAAEIVEG